MLAIRWMLAKDLRILRRSPALTLLLIIYPAVVAVLIGLALSRGPGLPRVAFLNGIPPSQTVITLGKTRIDTRRYERQLFQAIDPVPVSSRAQALADVRNGSTIAALIIPPDLPRRLASGDQSAYVEVIYNGDAVNQSLVQTAIESKLAQANAGLAVQLERVAGGEIDLLLSGGKLNFLGLSFNVLGLRSSAQILRQVLAGLPPGSPLRARLDPVATFAKIAVQNLASSKAVIGAVGAPIVVRPLIINGRRTPLDFYAVAIAVTVSMMFVCLLLASGMLALEREENTFERLRRGLVSASALLGEKALLASVCAVAVGFAMLAGIGIFVPLHWDRVGLWVLALVGRRARLRDARGGARRAGARRARGLAAGAARLVPARLPRPRAPGRRRRPDSMTRSASSPRSSPSRRRSRRSTPPSTARTRACGPRSATSPRSSPASALLARVGLRR